MHEAITHALKHGSPKMRNLKSFHAHEKSEGGYHVAMHHGGKSSTHSAADLGAVQQMLEQHMGEPNEGEAEMPMGGPSGGAQY